MRIVALAVLISGAAFWGLNATASKLLYAPSAPVHFDGLGLFVARSAWCLVPFAVMMLLAWPKKPITRAVLARIGLAGLAFGPGCTGFYAVGVQHTSAAHAVLLFSLGPPVTAALAALVFRERLDFLRAAALGIGVLGAAVLTLTRSTSGATVLGDAFILVMIVSQATLALTVRDLGKRGYGPAFITGAFGAVASLLGIAFALITGRESAIAAPWHWDSTTLVWFFGVIVIGLSIYAQYAQSFALRVLPIATTTLVGFYSSILVGVLASVFIVGETLGPWAIVAGLLLSVALALAVAPARVLNSSPR